MIESLLESLAEGRDLTFDEMRAVTNRIMQGGCSDEQIARLLDGAGREGRNRRRGGRGRRRDARADDPHPHHANRRARHLRHRRRRARERSTSARPRPWSWRRLECRWPNTATAPITSRSGSADALAALGVNVDADVPTVEACLDELGICFCFAPLLHQSMKRVAPIRRQLGFPTIFNLLGPLANPAGADFSCWASARPGCGRCWPRRWHGWEYGGRWWSAGDDGLGEVTLSGPTAVTEVVDGSSQRVPLDARRFWPAAGAARSAARGRPGRECGDDSPGPGRRWPGRPRRGGAERRRGTVDRRA